MRSAAFLGPLLVGILAGCGAPAPGPAAQPTVTLDEHPQPVPPAAGEAPKPKTSSPLLSPIYALLFEKDRSWKLSGTSKDSGWDDTKQSNVTTDGTWEGRCTVVAVKSMEWGKASMIECEEVAENGVANPVHGWWAATAAGLFHSDGEPDADPSQGSERPILKASPEPEQIEEQSPDGPDFGTRYTVSHSGEQWCSSESSWGGDEGWTEICFSEGHGIVGGQYGWAGGSTHEYTFSAR